MTESPWSDAVAATAIARLDKIGPRRIAAVLAGRGPGAAREAVVAGEPIPSRSSPVGVAPSPRPTRLRSRPTFVAPICRRRGSVHPATRPS